MNDLNESNIGKSSAIVKKNVKDKIVVTEGIKKSTSTENTEKSTSTENTEKSMSTKNKEKNRSTTKNIARNNSASRPRFKEYAAGASATDDNVKDKIDMAEAAIEDEPHDAALGKHKVSYINIALVVFLVISLCVAICLLVAFKFNKYQITMDIDDYTNVTLEYGDTYVLPQVKAQGCGSVFERDGVELNVEQIGDIDLSTVGEYTVLYRTTYKDITKEAEVTVDIRDDEAPTITLVANPDTFTKPNEEYAEEGYSAWDNYDGDITDRVARSVADGVVTYTVSDSSGNEATATRQIVYKDVVAPELTLKGEGSISVLVGTSYNEPGYVATDDVEGDITSNVSIEGSVDTSKAGTYTLVYKVSDKYGNEASTTRVVSVYNKQADNATSQGKVIYLTFDDGPGAYTGELLDVLDKYNVKATFFVTAQYSGCIDYIGEEYRRGHTVAVHSYTHNYSIYESESTYFDDLEKMMAICEQQTGVRPSIIRFPGGSSNSTSKQYCTGIMSKLVRAVSDKGLLYCDWNVSSGDASGSGTKDTVYQNVINGVSSRNTAVVLQHDVHKFSVDAVDDIISWGLANGYTFLPLTNADEMVHHGVVN